MDALTALHNRASTSARFLDAPAPQGEDLDAILRAAVTAPDHGALRPWRFFVLEGKSLEAMGELFGESHRARNPDAADHEIARQRDKASRSPLMIVVAAIITPDHPKAPEIEQILSAGCAAQHMQIAAQALGYGSVWVTGDKAFDPTIKESLGLAEKDHIVGFLHMGTPRGDRPQPQRPDPAEFTAHWPLES